MPTRAPLRDQVGTASAGHHSYGFSRLVDPIGDAYTGEFLCFFHKNATLTN
jgi:hypothetical protein